jgi:hypothetical protein
MSSIIALPDTPRHHAGNPLFSNTMSGSELWISKPIKKANLQSQQTIGK